MKKPFTISPRILLHFGEELIKNESIALLELVKNSYDACAKNCTIQFNFDNEKLAKIIVTDDGYGMNLDVIENVWLRIGTENKFVNFYNNKCNRFPLGEKGIGRLSAHKLGNVITLISKMKHDNEIKLLLDWNKLDIKKEVKDFLIEYTEEKENSNFKNGHGTIIIVEDLKQNWDRRKLREVYRNLISLNSPFENLSDSFNVLPQSNINVFEGLPDFEDIKKSAIYFGHCKMEGDKLTDFRYEFKPWKSLSKVDKGRKVKLTDLIEEDLYLKKLENRKLYYIDLDNHKIGPIEFDIIIFETDSQIFSYVNAEKSSIKNYIKENGGVRVYRDGIRVYDYGEKDNDWLGIDLKRVHRVGGNVSNNIIIGSVKINREKSFGLIEKTNREGFLENESYYVFTQAVNYALSLFVRERNIDKEILANLYKKHKVIEPVLSDLADVIHIVEENVKEANIRNEILKYLGRIDKQYTEVKNVLLKSANVGLNLSSVIHGIEKLVSSLVGALKRNEYNIAINMSMLLEKAIRGYTAMIKNSDIRLTPLKDIVSVALDNYEFRFNDHKIKIISNHINSNLLAYLAESESISVLTNILDNSIFWLKYAKKINRVISIFITDQINGYNSIIVSDNGPGFNLPFELAIKPFISGKPHNIGSGIGLHVASEMMTSMKGQLIICNKHEVELPPEINESEINKSIICLSFPKEKTKKKND